jgi:hypothetical protein
MKISAWLDKQVSENIDVSHVELPADLIYDDDPDETLYFKEIKPCGLFCTENHPYATVERFDHWYYCRGQDKQAGIHSSEMKWWLFTRDKELALKTAKAHID